MDDASASDHERNSPRPIDGIQLLKVSPLRITLILSSLAMLGPFATDTYLPSFPAMAREFAKGPREIQQTLSFYLFAYALMSLFWGTLSDSFGRRRTVLVALGIFLVSSIGAACSPGLSVLLPFRVLQGLSAGAGMVVGQAIVRDVYSGADAQKLIANITMVFGIAPAIAPIVGGWMQVTYGWRADFVFMALFTGGLFLSCVWRLPDTLRITARQPFRLSVLAGNYRRVAGHLQFVLRCLAGGCAFSGFALYISSAANFIIEILKLSPMAFGWLFWPLIGGLVLGSTLSAKLAHRVKSRSMIVIGFTIMAVADLANIIYTLLCTPRVPWAVLPIMVYSLGLAFAVPSMALKTMGMFPDTRGMAASLQNFMQMMIFALVSGFVAPLLFGSAFKLAVGVAVGWFFAAAFWLSAGYLASRSESDTS